jgi:hypothetical protein
MATTSNQLTAMDTRNQVMLERVKSGEHAKFLPFLKKIDRGLRYRLSDEGETIRNKKRLDKLLADTKALQREIYDDYLNQLSGDLLDIGVQQAGYQSKALTSTVIGFEAVTPSAEAESVGS